MIHDPCTLDHAIGVLNEMVAADPVAARSLTDHRVPCNDTLKDHPTIQVLAFEGEPALVGMLGVLNGIFGADEDGWGAVVAEFSDDETQLIRFRRRQLSDKPVEE